MVQRDEQCDESYRHFVESALVIKDQATGEPISKKVLFFGSFDASSVAADQKLECYVLREDEFKIQK